ncbi:MAG: GGDEF domain-containing protein [Spirochaetaceae bacterium]|nr:GGDEF domain-containing protein [Spirochaetaceae bacterium]
MSRRRKKGAPGASLLEGIPIFSRLDGTSAGELVARMKRHELPAGTDVFREGELGDRLYVILSGKVAISVTTPAGEALLLSEIGSGGLFGEMAIIDHAPRSADCRAVEPTALLSLGAADFDALIEERPRAAVGILDSMLEITAGRLLKTGAFLSEMVRWGDAARARAVTDPMTGLFNRRYMEENFEGLLNRARVEGRELSLAMFDMDHFGDLNKKYGQAVGDRAIVEGALAFRRVFSPSDVLVRYGGDEFVFLLVGSGPDAAQRAFDALCAEFRSLRFPEHPDLRLSCSVGYASFPAHATSLDALKVAADKALYCAKEAGRDRASPAPLSEACT